MKRLLILLTFSTLSILTIHTIAVVSPTQATSPTPIPKTKTSSQPANPAVKPMIKVSDQAIKANKITVAEVVAAEDGWIVVHEIKNGKLGPMIGQTMVKKGKNTNVPVTIQGVKTGAKLSIMLHIDAGTKGKFEPAKDTMVKDVMGSLTLK